MAIPQAKTLHRLVFLSTQTSDFARETISCMVDNKHFPELDSCYHESSKHVHLLLSNTPPNLSRKGIDLDEKPKLRSRRPFPLPEPPIGPPGLGLRQPSGALAVAMKSTAARVDSRAFQILRPKAVEDNRSPRRSRALPRYGRSASPLALCGTPCLSVGGPLNNSHVPWQAIP